MRRAPIEQDPKFQAIIGKVEEEAGKNFAKKFGEQRKHQVGYACLLWREKLRILREKHGREWKTSYKLNPRKKYD